MSLKSNLDMSNVSYSSCDEYMTDDDDSKYNYLDVSLKYSSVSKSSDILKSCDNSQMIDKNKIVDISTIPSNDGFKSNAFVRTSDDKWGLAYEIDEKYPKNLPVVLSPKLPVISAVGTSRDGKSTLFNVYSNWFLKNFENDGWDVLIKTHAPFSPFVAKQSDDVVTNGIDYFEIPNKCLLFDCQGMQLRSAQHDHFLMLITYLISNVIILTVRERLDLQVLNNCLSVFSFLPDIPEQFRRNDKPILLIRIKDFQNMKKLREEPNYLNDYVAKWLEKSGDQYDKIKEAFLNTFEIKVFATAYPTLDENYEVNVHSETFFSENPTFLKFCEFLYSLSKDKKAPTSLESEESIISLVQSLQQNDKIDWKKLDLYYQITENRLRKYAQETLLSNPIVTDGIIKEMTGKELSAEFCRNLQKSVRDTKSNIFDVVYKDVAISIKNEVFNSIFDKYDLIINEAIKKNIEMGKEYTHDFFSNFKKKFHKKVDFKYFKTHIMEYFNDNKISLLTQIKYVDKVVYDECVQFIDAEEKYLQDLQNIISERNNIAEKSIYNAIREYDIDTKTKFYISKNLNAKSINDDHIIYLEIIQSIVNNDINEIIKNNNATWHLTEDLDIVCSNDIISYTIDQYICSVHTFDHMFFDYYWSCKTNLLTEKGFLLFTDNNKVNNDNNNKVNNDNNKVNNDNNKVNNDNNNKVNNDNNNKVNNDNNDVLCHIDISQNFKINFTKIFIPMTKDKNNIIFATDKFISNTHFIEQLNDILKLCKVDISNNNNCTDVKYILCDSFKYYESDYLYDTIRSQFFNFIGVFCKEQNIYFVCQ